MIKVAAARGEDGLPCCFGFGRGDAGEGVVVAECVGVGVEGFDSG